MTSPAAPSRVVSDAGRFRPLDGIRGLASLGVLAIHSGFAHSEGGAFGVDIFFALSGYLITGLLLNDVARNGTIRLLKFWARRTVRLLPPLAAALAVCVLIAKDMSPTMGGRGYFPDAFVAGLWTTDVLTTLDQGRNAVRPLFYTWTLSIEEQFYLVWPVVLAFAISSERVRRHLPVMLILLAALSWLDLALLWPAHAPSLPSIYARPDSRALPLLLGSALAIALRRETVSRFVQALGTTIAGALSAAIAAGAMILPGALNWKASTHVIVAVCSPAASIGGTCLIAFLVQRPKSIGARFLALPPFVAVGIISYSLYLLQIPAIRFMYFRGWLPHGGVQQGLTAAGSAFVAALVLWAAVERPVLAWLRKTPAVVEPLAVTAASPTGEDVTPEPPKTTSRPGLVWRVAGYVPVTFISTGTLASVYVARH